MRPELRMQVEAMAKQLGVRFSKFQTRVIAQRIYRKGWSSPGCGPQECARRRRQIERGQLTKSNGLAI
jgi:hypothetical protein